MSGFTIEQQRAIALANGRARAAADTDSETPPEDKVSQIPGSFGGEVVKPSKGVDVPLPGVGTAEAAAAVGSGMFGQLAGQVGAFAKGLLRPETYTAKGNPEQFKKDASAISQALTYQPRTQQGQETLSGFGEMMDASKLAGLPPTAGVSLANMAPQRLNAARGALPAVSEAQPAAIPGMGAANVPLSSLRAERAAQFPVPADKLLTKGIITRNFADQAFERETAKDPNLGRPIRERHEALNENLHQNLQAMKDQTEAQAGSPRATGEAVVSVLAKKSQAAKSKVDQAYTAARAAGEMEQPVNVEPLAEYLAKNRSETLNAGVIGSTKGALGFLTGPQKKDVFGQPIARELSLNDLEEIRKRAVVAQSNGGANAHYGREINKIIDRITEGAGGDAYKYARRLNTQYMNEFSDTGVIEKMLRMNGRDRAVAFEDVFDHAIKRGSLDDVRAVRRSLQTAGPEGEQAWKELQGATAQHIYDQATKGATKDANNRVPISAAQLKRTVGELDKDGKLDFIFGKKGGEVMRDFVEHSLDVQTFPPGSVNTSGTAATLIAALAEAGGWTAATGIPMPFVSAGRAIKKHMESKKTQRRVLEHLNPEGVVSLKDIAAPQQNRNALRAQP